MKIGETHKEDLEKERVEERERVKELETRKAELQQEIDMLKEREIALKEDVKVLSSSLLSSSLLFFLLSSDPFPQGPTREIPPNSKQIRARKHFPPFRREGSLRGKRGEPESEREVEEV